jgi:hypothetical protein
MEQSAIDQVDRTVEEQEALSENGGPEIPESVDETHDNAADSRVPESEIDESSADLAAAFQSPAVAEAADGSEDPSTSEPMVNEVSLLDAELPAVPETDDTAPPDDTASTAPKPEIVSDAEAPEPPEIAADVEMPGAPVESPIEQKSEPDVPDLEADVVAAAETAAPESGSGVTAEAPQEAEAIAPVLDADVVDTAAPSAPVVEPEAPQIAESKEPEELPVPVEELTWGFIDQHRKIHQKSGEIYRGHVVGRAYDNPDNQIAELEANFQPLLKEVEVLEADMTAAKSKIAVLGRVRKLKATAGRADALGDFENLFSRLRTLEQQVSSEVEERKAAKEALIARAEEIKDATDWKATGDAYKALFDEWKTIGATGKESDDTLWARFIGAREYFNQRRAKHFEERQEQWDANAALKQELIVKAHELSTSDEWRSTSDELRGLFTEWKKVGSAGRQADEELWQQFRGAQQHFYDRRSAAFEDNKLRKEQLCTRAIELSDSTDWEVTFNEMKAMMAEWRTIGTAGNRDNDNDLWNKFRTAQNQFFDRRFETQSAREQEQREALKSKEAIVSAIEALAYSADAVAASEEVAELKEKFDALPPARQDREDAMVRRIRKALGDIRVNAAAEGARRAVTWEGKIREALLKSRDQLESLKETVKIEDEALRAAQQAMEQANGTERSRLEQSVQALSDSLAENRSEIDRLQVSIKEIEQSLRG